MQLHPGPTSSNSSACPLDLRCSCRLHSLSPPCRAPAADCLTLSKRRAHSAGQGFVFCLLFAAWRKRRAVTRDCGTSCPRLGSSLSTSDISFIEARSRCQCRAAEPDGGAPAAGAGGATRSLSWSEKRLEHTNIVLPPQGCAVWWSRNYRWRWRRRCWPSWSNCAACARWTSREFSLSKESTAMPFTNSAAGGPAAATAQPVLASLPS